MRFSFCFRRCLRHEIVHARFRRDGRGGQRIVAGDHDGLDSHLAQLREPFLDSAFDHVFELDRRRASSCPYATTSGVPPRREISSTVLRDRLRKGAAG